MTMCIGLSTSAYSVGIAKMSEEFGVSQVAGQVGELDRQRQLG